ncbi:Retrovirus-related Pol poly from transposon, partial [Brachionus plicatilis]
MRQIETEKVYKIQDLINYTDCKMSSFDKQPFYNITTSKSDALQNRRYAIQPNLKQTFGGNFKSNSYPYNNPREPNNQRQDKTFNPHQSTQKQVKFEDKGNSEPLHVINAVNLRKRPNRERPVIGVAIFNNTLVNYLCDSGADRTIINTKTFNLLKRHAPGTELEIHSGSELYSCSGPIKILGKVKLSRCIVSREEILKNVEILVTETVSNNDCLLGRDLINKLKHIGPRFEHIKTIVKTMFNEVTGTVIETEIVAELKETSLSKDDLNMEAVENARAFLKNKIEEVSEKSVLDLKPERNSDVAFEIEFQDPNQKPIKCRCRPIPWNLKEKVNTELDRQLKAGIIRPISFEKSVPVEFEIQLLGNVISKVSTSSESGSEHSIDDATQNTNSSSNSESEITNADRIALNPSSSIENEFESLKEEQEKDEDIQWIKGLILENGVQKPKISIFESPTRRILYKQYDHFTLVDGILYRHSEDRYGFKTTQLVLPKQVVERIVNQVLSTIYNGHLGKSKTMSKITDRFYRPFLKDDIMRCVKCCDVCQKIKLTQPARHAELIYLTPCLNEHGEVIVLEDYDDIVEKNLPAVATNYLQELKMKLKKCYQMATKNRNCRMDKAKLDHDRKIKKFMYNIGDYVLTDHPKLKKGLSHGLDTNTMDHLWKPIENHNEPEHNVTDTISTQPMSTGNVSSSDSDSDVGVLKSNSELRRSTRQSKPPDRL